MMVQNPDIVVIGAGAAGIGAGLALTRLGIPPGRAQARKVFAAPVHDRIFLAGEHLHQRYMATAHTGPMKPGLMQRTRRLPPWAFRLGKKTLCGCPPKLVDFLPQGSYIGWNKD